MSARETPMGKGFGPGPFQRLIGLEPPVIAEGRATIRLVLGPDHMNRQDRPHGGLICTLLDCAMGEAVSHRDGRPPFRTLTLNMSTNFIAAARGASITAEGWRTGGGRTTVFAEAVVKDEDGTVLATAQGTFRVKEQ
ncbi:PaaI family thioesterase [Tropicimonas sp. IMCC34011]|uniref:PaaI family thioesterase n=1 Tax=Tropicimonas sp. IMCC34011 TaxID=2248759 RepID=UPI001300A8C6|nr:PaaI family thioesterase [Tropicimonas sp. IMCC34011]